MDRAYSPAAEKVKTLIERRYSRGGRNYAYVTGRTSSHTRRILLSGLTTFPLLVSQ